MSTNKTTPVVEFVELDQIWADETTNYWFTVNGESFAISDCNGQHSLLDSEGFDIAKCNDHDGIFNLLMAHKSAPDAI